MASKRELTRQAKEDHASAVRRLDATRATDQQFNACEQLSSQGAARRVELDEGERLLDAS